MKRGDREALTGAVLIQGILSGDVVSASIAERQRLQKENLKLRQRLTHAKLRTERAKAVLLERASIDRPALVGDALMHELYGIYGMDYRPHRALPEPAVEAEIVPTVSAVPPENCPDPPVREEKETDLPPRTAPNLENE